MTNHTLSPCQQQIYDFIHQYQDEHTYSPTQQEIAEAMGISRQAIRAHLKALLKKEYIQWNEHIHRSIQIRIT